MHKAVLAYYVDANGNQVPLSLDTLNSSVLNEYYPRMKSYNYSSGRVKYICHNTDIDAAETDTDWSIFKYVDSDAMEYEGPRTGAVNTEAAIDGLSWNI